MAKTGAKVIGLELVKKALIDASTDVDEKYGRPETARIARNMVREIKAKMPKRTGFLRKNIGFVRSRRTTGTWIGLGKSRFKVKASKKQGGQLSKQKYPVPYYYRRNERTRVPYFELALREMQPWVSAALKRSAKFAVKRSADVNFSKQQKRLKSQLRNNARKL